jgi:methylase of polypeptide subunit release factors
LAIADHLSVGSLILSDINDQALDFAMINAAVQGRSVQRERSDLLHNVKGNFDLIIANPPYMSDPSKRAYREGGGPLGLELGFRIVTEGAPRLAAGGALYLYTGVPICAGSDPLLAYVERNLSQSEFSLSYSEIDPDVFGEELVRPEYSAVDRIAAVSLVLIRH